MSRRTYNEFACSVIEVEVAGKLVDLRNAKGFAVEATREHPITTGTFTIIKRDGSREEVKGRPITVRDKETKRLIAMEEPAP